MTEQTTRELLLNSMRARAMLYYALYKEFSAEIGPEKTVQIMKRAIYNRGLEIGKRFKRFAPDDMEALKKAFLDFLPDPKATFNPEVERCDDAGLDLIITTCPLKDAWKEAGLSDDEVMVMTEIAGELDKATFEGAGFAFNPDTWRPGRQGCCHLHVRPGRQAR